MLKDFRRLFSNANGVRNEIQPSRSMVLLAALGCLNLLALFFCLKPPGGTAGELARTIEQQHRQINTTRLQTIRWRKLASRVRQSGTEVADFQKRSFLPKRVAYAQIISEIARMSKSAELQERDGVFTEEPIEGTLDLALLNVTSSFQGSYENLMRFLHEADRSSMLIIVDNLQASPEQKGGQINVSIRFQAVIRDSSVSITGAHP